MVCTHVLIGLLLFFLSSTRGIEEEEINLNYLSTIIQFFDTKYKPDGQTPTNDSLQYAVAINVPADKCRSAIDQNFLSGEDAEMVKQNLRDKYLYQGQQLVAATPSGKSRSKIHSERALLMCEDEQAITPMKNLLNKDKDGCVVFYTYNSPCLQYCLNQKRDDDANKSEKIQRERGKTNVPAAVEKCILKSLSILTEHHGPKAFVFSQVYRNDRNETKREELATALEKVARLVHLYRCNTDSCVKCLYNNEIINDCLPEEDPINTMPSYEDIIQ